MEGILGDTDHYPFHALRRVEERKPGRKEASKPSSVVFDFATALEDHQPSRPKFSVLLRDFRSPIFRSLRLVEGVKLPDIREREPRKEVESGRPRSVSSVGSGASKGKKTIKPVLDGFMLLDASRVDDPKDATEAVLNDVSLAGVLQEDLSFFPNLTYLDLGENNIPFEALAPLKSLCELHLHCNALRSIQCPDDAFKKLETLNLSYNALRDDVFKELRKLPSLRQLDLSHNFIITIPRSITAMKTLERLSLEKNMLAHEDVFIGLGSLPKLMDLNLNHNRIPNAPETVIGFPSLRVLSICYNSFEFYEDVFPVTQVATLKAILLYGNPLISRKEDVYDLEYECMEIDKVLITESTDSISETRPSVGVFYQTLTELPPSRDILDARRPIEVFPQRDEANGDEDDDDGEEDKEEGGDISDDEYPPRSSGPSFFLTQDPGIDDGDAALDQPVEHGTDWTPRAHGLQQALHQLRLAIEHPVSSKASAQKEAPISSSQKKGKKGKKGRKRVSGSSPLGLGMKKNLRRIRGSPTV